MKRGEIYFADTSGRLGSTDVKTGRPAVVVSPPEVIEHTDSVSVVYLTTRPWNDLPTHVSINSTGRASVALCEHVSTTSQRHLGDLCGVCTEAEMAKIDDALMLALGIVEAEYLEDPEPPQAGEIAADALRELLRVQGERDAYKTMVEKLMAERG